MENTKTLNVISTPNIEGNVGSCTTKSERVVSEARMWSTTGQNIVTNSCTGKQDIYPFYEVSGLPVFLVLAGFFIFGFIVKAITE